MSDGFHLLDIIFFAMVAAFLVLRLRSVLGRRTGNERPPPGLAPRRAPGMGPADNVIDLAAVRKPDAEAPIPGPAGPGLSAIRAADPSFAPEGFLEGARAAFGMIVAAFAAGDTRTLRPLLSDEVYRHFAAAIEARAKAGERLETELVRIRSAEAVEAGLEGGLARITVRFASDQVNVLRGTDGAVVEGDPDRVAEVVDEWSFARELRSPNPNWALVATRSPEA
jgi:predicted lipid-binding transport protein (Tim44 family)